jgi:hypothetical protein
MSSGSVRERLQASNNNGPDKAVTTDHSTSKWGTIQVTQRIENQRQVSYLLTCACGSQGQRVSQTELASGVVPVCRFCNGTGVAPSDARHSYTASVEQRVREDVVLSPRQRIDAEARKKEIEQFEKNGGE